MSKETAKEKARKTLQVKSDKYRDNYDRIFGKRLEPLYIEQEPMEKINDI